MNLSKGYLPYIFTIPAILLLFGGYVLAGLYKFYDVEILSAGIAWPWLASFTGALLLGRTREKIEDERVNQVRNFSFRFLSELLIVGFFTISVMGLFFESLILHNRRWIEPGGRLKTLNLAQTNSGLGLASLTLCKRAPQGRWRPRASVRTRAPPMGIVL